LFLSFPLGIRSVLLDQASQAIERAAYPFKDPNLARLNLSLRLDHITDSLEMGRNLAVPYRQASLEIDDRLQKRLASALSMERAGDIQAAVHSYEHCIENGFLGSVPYERLRILYTRSHDYRSAIRVCTRYIEILKMVSNFWPEYAALRQIPEYEERIGKLAART